MNLTTHKQKILIVDDVAANIKMLIETFKSEYEIRFASNGHEALEIAFSDFSPDLVLLDIIMPGMDGYEVCKKLKANYLTKKIPVIFITAKDEESYETKGFEIGAAEYIKKPFNQAIVRERVKTHISLKNARKILENQKNILKEKVRERTSELEKTQIEVVERLGLAAEYRDEETGNHVKRLGEYCRLLGRAAGLSSDECEILALSSTLHDVGKIGIPDSILLKPGKLNAEEWEIMKTHATIGAKLLSGSTSKFLQTAESIALTHHEKWDGSGYPLGVKGERIPLEGRITCICDGFDALVSRRHYKDAWPIDKAIEEIKNNAGIQYDPNLVRHFIELKPKLKIIFEGLK